MLQTTGKLCSHLFIISTSAAWVQKQSCTEAKVIPWDHNAMEVNIMCELTSNN